MALTASRFIDADPCRPYRRGPTVRSHGKFNKQLTCGPTSADVEDTRGHYKKGKEEVTINGVFRKLTASERCTENPPLLGGVYAPLYTP